MKVTYNWLKDFVDITLRPKDLADKLTMAGLEVTALNKFQDDYVFETEITSNRPDWLSVIGIAREVAAVTGKRLKQVTGNRLQVTGNERRRTALRLPSGQVDEGQFSIILEDEKACPFYSARIIRNVKVRPSPSWLVKRLRAIGLRSINNIVDITNYILFTTGQPLHAFDLDKTNSHKSQATGHRSKIIVRRARNGEEIVTIDAIKRKLAPGILVIANENNPAAIAGIMGGKDTEVNESTRNIILESAYFSPLDIRRASRLLGLSSDSSYRFERSVDKSRIVDSSNFASSLILENAGGEIGKLYSCGSTEYSEKAVTLNSRNVNKLLGYNLPISKIKSILKALEFKITSEKKDVFKIKTPRFRQDVKSEIDLIEELSRISGYENIPTTLPAIKSPKIKQDGTLLIQEKIRNLLLGLGFKEVITYSLLSEESLKKLRVDLENIVCLENPLSTEQEILRPGLMAGLLTTLGRNLELGIRRCAFFEIGDCFHQDGEFRFLGLVVENGGLLELKGKLELLFQKLAIRNYKFSSASRPLFKNGHCASIAVLGKEVGLIGQITQEILLALKIDNSQVAALEINLDKLKSAVNFHKSCKPLPKYPSVTRDLSLVVNEGVSYQEILDAINISRQEYLENIQFKGQYRSEAIGRGKKSITVSLEFRSSRETLIDSQVNSYLENIRGAISKELGGVVR